MGGVTTAERNGCHTLLADAKASGLDVWADGEVLRFKGPDTPEKNRLVKLLTSRKVDVLRILNGEPASPNEDELPPTFTPVLIRMSDVEARPISWLWPNRIAAGRMTLLVGVPGSAKSFLSLDSASRVSTGSPWPDGSHCPKGSMILISAEDDPHDTIRPRLDAHRADVSRIHLLSTIRHRDDKGQESEIMFTLAHLDMLEAALQRVDDCKLIVVDPIGSFLGGRTDAHRDNEVRSILAPVAMLAEKYGPAVVVIAHRRKSAGTSADETALGSRAFTGLARSVWHVCRDSEDKGRRLFLPGKSNLAAEQPGLAFSIAGEPAAVCWEHEPVDMSADEGMAKEGADAGHESALDEAARWLEGLLVCGPQPGNKVKDQAHRDGIAVRTLERAKAKLGVVNGPDGFGGPWVWSLPESANESTVSPESAKEKLLANTEDTGPDLADTGATESAN